jgi:ATP-dependent protease ClpP protease subunit
MPGTARVTINGPIVSAPDENTQWPYTTLQSVQEQLDWQAPYTDVWVTINSQGGNADEGFGIYDLLRTQPVPVTTEAVGQCSSIASIIFLAGTTRRAHKNLNYTVHYPFGGASGTAAEVTAFALALQDLENRLVGTYTERGTVTDEVIRPLLQADTALTSEQLLAFGLATLIVEPVLALASFNRRNISATTNPAAAAAPKPMALPAKKPAAATAPRMNISQAWAAVKAAVLGTRFAMSVTTDAGAALEIANAEGADPAAGDAVTDAEGNPAADGTYTLDTKATVTVKDGKVETYTPAPAASTADAEANAAADETEEVDVTATPTTLEEAQRIIQALQGNQRSAAAPATRSAAAPAQRRAAAPAAAAAPNQQLLDSLNVLGSLITSGGAGVEANDTNTRHASSSRGGASTVADANSEAAKQAALDNIRSRNAKNATTRNGQRR